MKRAWLRISPELLIDVLCLPFGTSIEQVMFANNDRDLLFFLDSPDLKEIDDDDYAPEVHGEWCRHEPVEFVGWKYYE